jgi:hypothetical protein
MHECAVEGRGGRKEISLRRRKHAAFGSRRVDQSMQPLAGSATHLLLLPD